MHDNFTCVFSIPVKFKIYFLRLNLMISVLNCQYTETFQPKYIFLSEWMANIPWSCLIHLKGESCWVTVLGSFCPDKAVVNGLVCCNSKCIIQDHSLVIMQATNKKTEKKMLFIHLSWHASHCTMSLRIPLFESLIYYFFITLKHQTQQQSVLPVK